MNIGLNFSSGFCRIQKALQTSQDLKVLNLTLSSYSLANVKLLKKFKFFPTSYVLQAAYCSSNTAQYSFVDYITEFHIGVTRAVGFQLLPTSALVLYQLGCY